MLRSEGEEGLKHHFGGSHVKGQILTFFPDWLRNYAPKLALL